MPIGTRPRSSKEPGHTKSAFFREFFRSPRELGTCFTSTPTLARAMTDGIGLETARVVVEYGPGTGPVTSQILARIPADCRFIAIERNGEMVRVLRERFPQVRLYEDDAGEVRAICAREGIAPAQVDAIVSALPFTLMPRAVQERILAETGAMLRPGGSFVTITYRPAAIMPSARRLRALMERNIGPTRLARSVLGNIPPAFVYKVRRAAATPAITTRSQRAAAPAGPQASSGATR